MTSSVGFHLDFGAWKGDERTKRLLPCVIFVELPCHSTYALRSLYVLWFYKIEEIGGGGIRFILEKATNY